MKIRVIAVGRLKEKFYTDAVNEFSKRLSRFAEVEIVEVADDRVPNDPSPAEIEKVKEAECERIASKLNKDDFVIALDPRGKQFSSEELAGTLSELMLNGRSRIAFVIGGSHGLTDGIRKNADLTLSFSKMTFSHQVFRVMLMEQIYRAFKILSGEPYHK
ncbi:MAG: 23S rRNA (pseudouridine(1915)-N(3))-methyltransferase RlmH [Clostridiales bacterium]|nr:23S rRNA (pseudouridine(1915)-N(3))-methyltransferase RlmH [Clostridiales bacterium]